MIGKVPPDVLEGILDRTGRRDDAVRQHAAYGEDAACVDLGDRQLVISADPLSMASEQLGRIGIHVVCNDVAASGARPRWITNTMFLPNDDPNVLETITSQLHATALQLDLSIVGGHTEYNPDLSRPLLSLCAFGTTDRFVPTGGAEPGDVVLMTHAAGIEGTAILATDFEDRLRDAGVDTDIVDRGAEMIDDIGVLEAAMACRSSASAMHDPTEGGIVTGLVEMAHASGVTIEAHREQIDVHPETTTICQAMGIDPLAIFGSGALIVAVSPEQAASLQGDLMENGVESSIIGRAREGPSQLKLDGERIDAAPRDELYELWA